MSTWRPAASAGAMEPAHVLAPILDEPAQLLLGRDGRRAAVRHGADPAPVLAVGRLAGDERVVTGLLQRFGEPGDLGGLAAAVEALEHDQSPAVHGRAVDERSPGRESARWLVMEIPVRTTAIPRRARRARLARRLLSQCAVPSGTPATPLLTGPGEGGNPGRRAGARYRRGTQTG